MPVFAEVPHAIKYQGRLFDGTGAPVPDGYYNITFTIYDDPTLVSHHVIWSSGQQSVAVTNGLYTYLLGPICLSCKNSRFYFG